MYRQVYEQHLLVGLLTWPRQSRVFVHHLLYRLGPGGLAVYIHPKDGMVSRILWRYVLYVFMISPVISGGQLSTRILPRIFASPSNPAQL